jgi:hypothetical protein
MAEEYGKREQFGRLFSDNKLLGDDYTFPQKPINEQVDSIAWSEGCPVKNRVVGNNGPEVARDRYGEIIFARQMILEEAREHNPQLYQDLTVSLTRNPNEPVGKHEPESVPQSHITTIDANNTPWGFSLPRILLDQFGKRDNRTQGRIQSGLEMLEEIVKEVHSPLEFMAVLAEQAVKADADIDTVLKSTLSRGYLGEENTHKLYHELAIQLQKHAPTLWQRYLELDIHQRTKFGIADLPGTLTRFEWNNASQQINFIKTMQVASGVECDVYTFSGDKSKDLGVIRILPGCKTPLQKVLQGEQTIEGYVSGKGKLIVTRSNGKADTYDVGSIPDEKLSINVMIGDTMQWHADPDSPLEVYEICLPPYAEGRYENISEA